MCVCLCVCIGGETCLKDQAEMTVGSGRGEGGMPLKRVDRVQFHDHPTGVCWLDERGQQVGRGGDKTILCPPPPPQFRSGLGSGFVS